MCGEPIEPADEGVLKQRLPFWSGTVRAAHRGDARRAAGLRPGPGEQLREIFLLARPLRSADGEVLIRENDYTDSFLACPRTAARSLRKARRR